MGGGTRGRWARAFPKTFLEVGLFAAISSSRIERELIRNISSRLSVYRKDSGRIVDVGHSSPITPPLGWFRHREGSLDGILVLSRRDVENSRGWLGVALTSGIRA